MSRKYNKKKRGSRLTKLLLTVVLVLAAALGWNIYTLVTPSRQPNREMEQVQEQSHETEGEAEEPKENSDKEQTPVEILQNLL